jgi:1,4-alpha-glucan branching enzyme
LESGHLYKYEIRNRYTGEIQLKADPYGQQHELRPNTASSFPNQKITSGVMRTGCQKELMWNGNTVRCRSMRFI